MITLFKKSTQSNFCYFALIFISLLFTASKSQLASKAVLLKQDELHDSKSFLKNELSKLEKKDSAVSLLQTIKREEISFDDADEKEGKNHKDNKDKLTDPITTTSNKPNNTLKNFENNTATFFSKVGQSLKDFFDLSVVKLKVLKTYIFVNNGDKDTWVEVYLLPSIKIGGLIALCIIVIMLMKFVFSKFTEKLANKSRNEAEKPSINSKKEQEYKPLPQSLKPEPKESIKIKGRKKKMPNNLNYNELFNNINSVDARGAKTISDTKENKTLTIEEFFDHVDRNEKKTTDHNAKCDLISDSFVDNLKGGIKKSKSDLLFFDNREDEEDSLMLIKDIHEMDKAKKNKLNSKENEPACKVENEVEEESEVEKVEKKSSTVSTLSDRLRNKELFQQTLIATCMRNKSCK